MINNGVTVTANSITNYGNLTNYGLFRQLQFYNFVNDGGNIENYGTLQNDQGQFYNIHSGKINVKSAGSLQILAFSSAMPGKFTNDQNSVVDNFGEFSAAGDGGYHPATTQNDGAMYMECNATYFIGPIVANPIVDKCSQNQTFTLTISSHGTNNNPISGYWTVLYDVSGNVVKTGFTPITFILNAGQGYRIGVGNYGSYAFDHWLDNSSTTNPRSGSLITDTVLTALYKNTSAPSPPTSTTYALTVRSVDTSNNVISGYWTVLYDESGNVLKTGFTPATFTLNSGQQYRIGMGNYGTHYFDHWQDNNTTTTPRSLSITADTTLTAVYKITR